MKFGQLEELKVKKMYAAISKLNVEIPYFLKAIAYNKIGGAVFVI